MNSHVCFEFTYMKVTIICDEIKQNEFSVMHISSFFLHSVIFSSWKLVMLEIQAIKGLQDNRNSLLCHISQPVTTSVRGSTDLRHIFDCKVRHRSFFEFELTTINE